MSRHTEEFRRRAIQIAEKIRHSLDEDESVAIKEIMDMRFALLTQEGLSENEIRLAGAYIDLVMGMYHDRMHLEYVEEFLPEPEEYEKERGH